jgi:signal transduction histidine kinase
MNDDLNSYKSNRITLRFSDSEMEKSFVGLYDDENRVANRIGTIVGAFSWVIMIAYGFIFEKDRIFDISWPIVFIVYPCFCLVIAVTFINRLTFICQAICAFGNLVAGLAAVYLETILIQTPQIVTFYICGFVIGAFFVLRLRFSIAVLISLSYVILYQISLVLPHRFPADAMVQNTAAIWIFESASIVGGYLFEKSVRKVFLQNLIIKGQRKTIEIEKEKSEGLLRKQLSHAEKLATMGTVVASVAHEINNPNNSLMLDAQFNQNAWRSASAVLDEYANENGALSIGGFGYGEFKTAVVDASNRMKRNTERIKHIVENLRAVAKKDDDFEEDVDLNETVRSALSVIEHFTSKYTRNLNVKLGASLPRIRGNPPSLEQVIINLVKNACQSLPGMEKGVFISTAFEPEKKAVSFAIRDEGKGMDEKTLKDIFTPFFTTKGKEGTGLGLSICNNIIKNHGGTTTIESKPGEGTTVTFLLPLPTVPAETDLEK